MPAKLDFQAVAPLLATWPVGRLALVSADGGGPWVAPIVFAPWGGAVWTPIDGKPKSGGPLQRLVNAEADPRASLLLDEYADDWTRLWWIRLDGTIQVHRAAGPASAHGAAIRAAAALREKYPQYREASLLADRPTLLELTVARIRGWSASGNGPPLPRTPPADTLPRTRSRGRLDRRRGAE